MTIITRTKVIINTYKWNDLFGKRELFHCVNFLLRAGIRVAKHCDRFTGHVLITPWHCYLVWWMDFLLQMDVVILLVNSLAVNVFRSGRELSGLEHFWLLQRILITVFSYLYSRTSQKTSKLSRNERKTHELKTNSNFDGG